MINPLLLLFFVLISVITNNNRNRQTQNYQTYENYSNDISLYSNKAKYDPLVWYTDYNEALIDAKKSQKQILVFFNSWSSSNCKYMENNILLDLDVIEKLENYLLVKLYIDTQNKFEKENREIMRTLFNNEDVPKFYILNAQGKIIKQLGLTTDLEEFLLFLENKN